MVRAFAVALVTLTLIITLAISGCTIPGLDALISPNVLYLQHEVHMDGNLLSITYTAPPGMNVTLNNSDGALYYSIDSGRQEPLISPLWADSFTWVEFNGTHLMVADSDLVGDTNLTAINGYSGYESGFTGNAFGHNWVNQAKGTRQFPDNIGYRRDMPVMLTGIEGGGTAILSYDNQTYKLPAGQTVEFSKYLETNSTIAKGNVSFMLVGGLNMSDKITNRGWVKASNIVYS